MATQSKFGELARAGGAKRVNFLNRCVLEGMSDYIFEFMLEQYRDAPTKSKAIALFDTFCAREAPYRLNCDELLPPNNLQFEALIGLFRDMRAEAQQMNVFKRMFTSSNRVPPREQFDFLLPAVFRQEDVIAMTNLVGDGTRTVAAPAKGSVQANFLTSWSKTRKLLVDAGFSTIKCTMG